MAVGEGDGLGEGVGLGVSVGAAVGTLEGDGTGVGVPLDDPQAAAISPIPSAAIAARHVDRPAIVRPRSAVAPSGLRLAERTPDRASGRITPLAVP
jgi:hypothetical protein